ncbi:MarR family winged helix-turn-helix transcriptional regulator [Hydrocarboniphaga sp.]|uniref:MarR family winged helix-turn-helix transcriptional regulator n=1 Tax=Hydrocarboniphaga sp. TaxID=2033016 RepID=UPI003D0AA55C
MKARAKSGTAADRIWQLLVALVMDSRGDWRRKVSELTGMPFSRWRALKRLVDAPLTLRELAELMNTDAPATTVAVNDLEQRGLVERRPHPDNARAKLVSITAAGRRVMDSTRSIADHAPAAISELPAADLAELERILAAIATHSEK